MAPHGRVLRPCGRTAPRMGLEGNAMKARISVSAIIFLVVPWAGAAQELLPGSEKAKYRELEIAPDKKTIAAIADLPIEPAAAGGTWLVSSLHFFDRAKKTKVELTPKGPVFGNQGIDDGCGVECIAFWPDGRGLLAGGWGFFAGWEYPTRGISFLRRGHPDQFLDRFEINQIVAAKKGARVALVTTRRLDGDFGPSTECKLTLWQRGVSKDDIQSVRLNKRFNVPIAKLVAAISGNGDFLACYDKDAKKLTVHDVSKVEIKQHAEFDLNLPDVLMYRGRPAICFAHDNSVLWVLCKEKLYSFDLKTKKQGKTIEFKVEPFWIHALADGSSLLLAEIDEAKKEKATVVNLFDPKSQKAQGQINLGRVVAPLAISPDDALLAGAGETGIFTWNLPELLAKTRKQR